MMTTATIPISSAPSVGVSDSSGSRDAYVPAPVEISAPVEVAVQRVSSPSASKTVLVAEDQPELLELLSELFSADGYHILLAPDGEEAVRLARATHPDLIILDLMLPRKSGHEVLLDLGADPTTNDIPVVVVSAYTRSLQRTPQVKAVVEKPFDIWQLLDLAYQLSNQA